MAAVGRESVAARPPQPSDSALFGSGLGGDIAAAADVVHRQRRHERSDGSRGPGFLILPIELLKLIRARHQALQQGARALRKMTSPAVDSGRQVLRQPPDQSGGRLLFLLVAIDTEIFEDGL